MKITPLQLRWSDFDILQHVYNGQYQQLFDLGKSTYFEQVMGLQYNWPTSGEGLITASTYINYHTPIEMQEAVEAHTRVEKIGTKSFTVYQEIVNCQTGELKADCRTVLVGFNPIDKTTFELPLKWRKAIEEEENRK